MKNSLLKRKLILGLISLFIINCMTLPYPIGNKPSTQSTGIPVVNKDENLSHRNIYMILLEDSGKSGEKIGCGDSLIEVETQSKDNQAALVYLLNNHNQWYGQSGLYNALYQSNLSVSRWQETGDGIEIDLLGSMILGGSLR